MSRFWDGLYELFDYFYTHGASAVRGAYWVFTGQFMPSTCTWCKPVWMIGIVAVVFLSIAHLRSAGARAK